MKRPAASVGPGEKCRQLPRYPADFEGCGECTLQAPIRTDEHNARRMQNVIPVGPGFVLRDPVGDPQVRGQGSELFRVSGDAGKLRVEVRDVPGQNCRRIAFRIDGYKNHSIKSSTIVGPPGQLRAEAAQVFQDAATRFMGIRSSM